jgi:hypothetical protein
MPQQPIVFTQDIIITYCCNNGDHAANLMNRFCKKECFHPIYPVNLKNRHKFVATAAFCSRL